jgi:hypothetical protein
LSAARRERNRLVARQMGGLARHGYRVRTGAMRRHYISKADGTAILLLLEPIYDLRDGLPARLRLKRMVNRRRKPISDSEIAHHRPTPPRRKGGITTPLTVFSVSGVVI